MIYSIDVLHDDTAQVRHSTLDLFGSGRLVGRNLVITARHVITPEDAMQPLKEGWEVRLLRDRPNSVQAGRWSWIKASMAWPGTETLDIALLELRPEPGSLDLCPKLNFRIGRIDKVQHYRVRALGFPRGAKEEGKRVSFVPSGDLDDEKQATLSLGIDQAYQPDSPDEDWRGFSGAAVLLEDSPDPDAIWIYGVVQHVPQHFKRQLAVARLAAAWEDEHFRAIAQKAGIASDAPADPTSIDWRRLWSICKDQAQQQLKSLHYEAPLYVKRRHVEEQLQRFLESDKRVLPLIGDTGTGKSFFIGNAAASTSLTLPTVLLPAFRVSTQDESIKTSVLKELSRLAPGMFQIESLGSLNALAGRTGDFFLFLDGLNEVRGTAEETGRWLESSWNWLRTDRVRLIISCRPEYWSLIHDFLDSELLYVDSSSSAIDVRTKSISVKLGVTVNDFSEVEANEARALYGFIPAEELQSIFRHPFLFRIYREVRSLNDLNPASVYGLFEVYVNTIWRRVRASKEHSVSEAFLRATFERIASILRERKTLWLETGAFFELFQRDQWLADAFLAEHLLVEGEHGLRFSFDEIAYYFVAVSWVKDFETDVASVDLGVLRKDDPILYEATPLVVSRLEEQGKQKSVSSLLHALDSPVHNFLSLQSYTEHQLFLRSVQWLRKPSDYFEQIRQFAENCAKSRGSWPATDHWVEDHHPLFPLYTLPEMSQEQRFELLRAIAIRERDYGWRWRDWETLSHEDFWRFRDPADAWSGRDLENNTLKPFVCREIQTKSDFVIDTFVEGIDDPTLLATTSPPAEATVGDLACAFLFHSGPKYMRRISDALATRVEKGASDHAGLLLRTIASRHPLEMTAILEEWEANHLYSEVIGRVASGLVITRPEEAIVERIARVLDRLLRRSPSPQLQAALMESLSEIPSRVPEVLDLMEELTASSSVILEPSIFRALSKKAPERVLLTLKSIMETESDFSKQASGVDVLSTLDLSEKSAADMLLLLMNYLIRYPKLRNRLGSAIEHTISAMSATPEADRQILSAVTTIWQSDDETLRRKVIYGVLWRTGKSGCGVEVLRTIVDLDESNVDLLLERIPQSPLPVEDVFNLVKALARKATNHSEAETFLFAAGESECFATYLAGRVNDAGNSPLLLRFKQAVDSGVKADDAAQEILDTHNTSDI